MFQFDSIFYDNPLSASFFMTTTMQSTSTKNQDDSELDTAEPPLYKVIILNDDYTPMDFVIYVLTQIFKHSETEAHKIMLDVHQQGSGIAGIYNFEIAETKSYQMNQLAKQNQYPLKSIVEEDN